ncbi:MAG TPA: hypothetical protein VNY34_00130 [Solirubrobacteraceae bacterium]|jgi:hypothetical protein|nr:hypothetical protein [Solirubrobacteraceae bacterium]
MTPALHMALARQRVADLMRTGERERRAAKPQPPAVKPVGPSYRLRDGSWIYRRRDSA